MQPSYHLPTDIAGAKDLSPQDRERLRAVVLPAIGAAVPQTTPAQAPPQPEQTKPSRWEQSTDGRAYSVPSYGKKGDHVGLPVGSKEGGRPEQVHRRLFREAADFFGIKDAGELGQLLLVAEWFSDTTTLKAFQEALRRHGLEGFWIRMGVRLTAVPRPAPSARLGADTIRMIFGPEADPRDPANPANTLSAREMFRIWLDYWSQRMARALERKATLEDGFGADDLATRSRKWYLFKLGDRDVFGPEYRAVVDELDTCRVITSVKVEVVGWLRNQEGEHQPVTWDEVNAVAVRAARVGNVLQVWMTPLVVLAAAAGPKPGSLAALDELQPASVRAPLPGPVAPAPAVEPVSAAAFPGGSIPSGRFSTWARSWALRFGLDRSMIGADSALPASRVTASARAASDPVPAPVVAGIPAAPASIAPTAQRLAPLPVSIDTEAMFARLETELPSVPVTAASGTGPAAAAADAQAAGLVGPRGAPGTVDLAVQRHADATAVRGQHQVSGAQIQSAHIGPTSFLRDVPGYSRSNADTALLPRAVHTSFDQLWKNWAIAQRRAGRTTCTVGELYGVMLLAIDQIPVLTDAAQNTIAWRLQLELFRDLGLQPGTVIDLPYGNISPSP